MTQNKDDQLQKKIQLNCNDQLLKTYILETIDRQKLKYSKQFDQFFKELFKIYDYQNDIQNNKDFELKFYLWQMKQEYSIKYCNNTQFIEKISQHIKKIIIEIKKSLNKNQVNSLIQLVQIIKFLIKITHNQIFALKLFRELIFFVRILIKRLEMEDESTMYFFEQTYFFNDNIILENMNMRFLNHCYFYKYRRLDIICILKSQIKYIIQNSFQLQLYNETNYFLQKHAFKFYKKFYMLKTYCFSQYYYFILNLEQSKEEQDESQYDIEIDIKDKQSFQIHIKYIVEQFFQKYDLLKDDFCYLNLDLYLLTKYLNILINKKVKIGQQFFNTIFIKSIFQKLQLQDAFDLQQKRVLIQELQGCSLIKFYTSAKFNDKKQMKLMNHLKARSSVLKFLQVNEVQDQIMLFKLQQLECYMLNNVSKICYKNDSKLQIHLQNFMLISFELCYFSFNFNFLHQSQKFFNIFCSLYIIFKRVFKRSYLLEETNLHDCDHCKSDHHQSENDFKIFLNLYLNNEYLLKYIYKKFWTQSLIYSDKNRKTLKRFTIANTKEFQNINDNSLMLKLIKNKQILEQLTYNNLEIINTQEFFVEQKYICLTHFEWIFDTNNIFPFFVVGNGFQQYFFSLGNSKIKDIYKSIENELQENEKHLKDYSKSQSGKEWWEVRIERDTNIQNLFNDLTSNLDYSILFFEGYETSHIEQQRLKDILNQIENVARKEDENDNLSKSIFYQNSIILLTNYINNFYKHELQQNQNQIQDENFNEFFVERIQKLIKNKVDFLSILSYTQQRIITKILYKNYIEKNNKNFDSIKYVSQKEQLNIKFLLFFLPN